MELIVKSRNGKVTDRQRDHIEEKLGKLDRYLDHARSVTVEISNERRRNQKNALHRLQVTLVGEHGIILRADQSDEDMFKAVDQVQDILQRQINRYKGKHWRRGRLRRRGDEFIPSEIEQIQAIDVREGEGESEEPAIVRVKKFALKPMFSDEAVEQMELLDHSFFVFRDADTSHISVIYRRRDGNYGLIVPEEV
jgi:putative sigma-54 modulation protein